MTIKGAVEIAPKTDDDWARVRIGAVVLAESASLLKIPRRTAPPGDLNNSTGPDAPELSPDAIKAKIDADHALWNTHAEGLRAVAADALLQTGGKLDKACENGRSLRVSSRKTGRRLRPTRRSSDVPWGATTKIK